MEKTKRYFIETYGCEMNRSDSIDIALSLEESGYRRAETRIFGRLGFYRTLKERKKDLTIVFAGCMAQEKSLDIVKRFPEVDVVAGTYHRLDIPDALQCLYRNGGPVLRIDTNRYEFSPYKGMRKDGHRAWVNIIKGCSNFCSYCIVPYVRGPEKSRASAEVVAEVEELADRGVVEIALLGQNVNAYGKDSGDVGFIDLLERLNEVQGIRWIRFLTSHPKDFNREIIKRIAQLDRVCSHVHLPLQSGSDRILSLMNRKYDSRSFLSIVESIRMFMPDSSITTDIIVGFPTETDEDFQMTLEMVREIEFDDGFTYRYSERPGTGAAGMKEVPAEIAARRLDELIALQRYISYRKNTAEIGKEVLGLVERPSRKNAEEMLCSTEKNKMVITATEEPTGVFIKLKIDGISGNTLRGTELQKTHPR
jgi:tRNA-2-methylthio-N6-dimethylallyladenosine synthase